MSTIHKLLLRKKQDSLASLLINSKSEIRSSSQFGSFWNSYISQFIIYLPLDDYVEAKKLTEDNLKILLESICEVIPPEENGPEITSVDFRILDDDADKSEPEVAKDSSGTFIDKSIRLFLSYSSIDGVVAGNIKKYLETYFGFEVFLAHEDIECGEEWQNVIVENLKSTDIFMPLLSHNFEESRFTDQETGMAYILGKKIIPITIEKDFTPYGFIKKIQGEKLGVNKDLSYEWLSFCERVITSIGKDPTFGSSVKSSLIRALKNSSSFAITRQIVHLIINQMPYSSKQVNNILLAYLDNVNVHDESYQIPSLVTKLLKDRKDLDREILNKLPRKYIEEEKEVSPDDIPF